MSLDSLVYLLAFLWPYLLGAMLIGIATGWLTFATAAE
jgi:hypothetical protein